MDTPASPEGHRHWIPAGDYHLCLDGREIRIADATGTLLKEVPADVAHSAAYTQLEQLRRLLRDHATTCFDTVQNWFLRQLPVPVPVLQAIWPDPTWSQLLDNLITSTAGGGALTGFLRGADAQGLHIVDRHGQSHLIPATTTEGSPQTVTLPHPILLEDLQAYREVATQYGIDQRIEQLFRDVYVKPTDPQDFHNAVSSFRGGSYDEGHQMLRQAGAAGFSAHLSAITVTVMDGDRETDCTLMVECAHPEESAWLDEVVFTRPFLRLRPEDVSPVAFSEGMRMAAIMHAGCSAEDNPTSASAP